MKQRIVKLPTGSILALTLLIVALPAAAENIDPVDDDSQYAWGENVGWINAEPGGDGADGVHVADFEVTGWMWGENVGWISLSCKTTGTCESIGYGIVNDGLGNLSGTAWAENVGWIDFDPAGDGRVWIDVIDGTFLGEAWGENVGWIAMSNFAAAHPYALRTGWNCAAPPPPPADPPWLNLEKVGPSETALFWNPVPDATGYDLVFGWLDVLRNDPGRFEAATIGCFGENLVDPSAVFPDIPPPAYAYWFLVRGVNCGDGGTYDSGGPRQDAPRDPGVFASGADCVVP